MNPSSRGRLIALEGIDGCGKSTLARGLKNIFEERGITCLLTREPGGSNLGGHIRSILQTKKSPVAAKAEFLLFAADRAQHFEEVVIPALTSGTLVLSDRLADSSLAYQGFGRGLEKDTIESINRWAMNGITPDYIIYLKMSVEDAFARIYNRKEPLTSFEKENYTFWELVSKGFDTIFSNRTNVFVIDATKSREQVLHEALQCLFPHLTP